MRYSQPYMVMLPNRDGIWGPYGDLERYLGKQVVTDSAHAATGFANEVPPVEGQAEATFYRTKFERSLKMLEELKDYHKSAIEKLENEIANAKTGLELFNEVSENQPPPASTPIDITLVLMNLCRMRGVSHVAKEFVERDLVRDHRDLERMKVLGRRNS